MFGSWTNRMCGAALLLTLTSLTASPIAAADGWNPTEFAGEDTLEFLTVNADGKEHWATVWFVLIDGDAYVRLGGRAERRIEENVHEPVVKIRIAERVFDGIVVEELPGRNTEVAEAMADKYWTAFLMPHMPERFTGRLMQEAPE